jgi:uncharacterized protein (TIGR02266 family)
VSSLFHSLCGGHFSLGLTGRKNSAQLIGYGVIHDVHGKCMTSEPRNNTDDSFSSEIGERKHPRVDLFTPVKVRPEGDKPIDVFAGNLSEGGIYLQSNDPLPKGKKVRLDFEVDQGRVEVTEGEVVWAQDLDAAQAKGNPPGMGIEFRKLDSGSRSNINLFIDEVLREDDPDPSPSSTLRASVLRSDLHEPEMDTVGEVEERFSGRIEKRDAGSSPLPFASLREDVNFRSGPTNEDAMVALSKPPSPKTRMLVFGLFVVFVAAVTFAVLVWLKPLGKEANDPTSGEVKASAARTEPEKQASAAKPTEKQNVDSGHSKAVSAVPKAVPEDKPKPKSESGSEMPNPGSPVLSEPRFVQEQGGWKLILEASSPLVFNLFTLKGPPRLVIDAKLASYPGQQLIQSPTPFIGRARFGRQPQAVRLVLDFVGSRVPKHSIQRSEKQIVISFQPKR